MPDHAIPLVMRDHLHKVLDEMLDKHRHVILLSYEDEPDDKGSLNVSRVTTDASEDRVIKIMIASAAMMRDVEPDIKYDEDDLSKGTN